MDSWKKQHYYSLLDAETRENIKTVRQWALMGYVPKDPDSGTMLYSNRYCQYSYFYYSLEEVRKGTEEELENFFAPERARRKAKAEAIREERMLYKPLKTFRAKCMKLAKTVPYLPEKRTRAIVIDTETTGLNATKNELLQVSIIDAETGKTLFNQYIKPVLATSWNAAEKVNGISPRKVANKPTFIDYVKPLQEIINSAETVIGYNTDFDLCFLSEAGLLFREEQEINYIDVMRDYAEIHNAGQWCKLTECANHYGYDWKNDKAHDSLSDCRATLHCYKALYR